MQSIIATNCDLRLARIIALLLDDSPCIKLTYHSGCYTLNAGPNDYLMNTDSLDFIGACPYPWAGVFFYGRTPRPRTSTVLYC